MHIVVADSNEPALLATESMLQHEAGTAAITVVREVAGAPSISDGEVIKPLFLGGFGARESVRYG